MVLAVVCQVGHVRERSLTCPAVESGGFRCERLDPHGDEGHRVGEHTMEHARRGNGWSCDGRRVMGLSSGRTSTFLIA
jgi:hypothetical protein